MNDVAEVALTQHKLKFLTSQSKTRQIYKIIRNVFAEKEILH